MALVLAVALAEVGVRLLSGMPPPLMCSHPVVCKTYLPNFAGDVYVEECDRKVHLRFQRDGFRGPDRPVEKPVGTKRVALLGDSMIAAISTDEEQTLAARLERMLNARPAGEAESGAAPRWEVLNFGVAGSSPGQAMVLYREIVAKYQPDVVLSAFFVGNDLSDMCARIGTNPHIYFDVDSDCKLVQLPFSAGRARATEWLNRHSRLYVWQRTALNKAGHHLRARIRNLASGAGTNKQRRKKQTPAPSNAETQPVAETTQLAGAPPQAEASPPTEAPPVASESVVADATSTSEPFNPSDARWIDAGQWVYLTRETEDVAHAWKITGQVIARFRQEVERDGARFAVLALPSPESVYDDYFAEVVRSARSVGPAMRADYPEQRLTGLCADAGAPLVAMRERFREASPQHSTQVADQWLYHLRGRGHFNDAGNRVAAEAVYDFLTRPRAELAEQPNLETTRR